VYREPRYTPKKLPKNRIGTLTSNLPNAPQIGKPTAAQLFCVATPGHLHLHIRLKLGINIWQLTKPLNTPAIGKSLTGTRVWQMKRLVANKETPTSRETARRPSALGGLAGHLHAASRKIIGLLLHLYGRKPNLRRSSISSSAFRAGARIQEVATCISCRIS